MNYTGPIGPIERAITLQIRRSIEGKEFYDDVMDNALKNLRQAHYRELFMPEIIDAKIEAQGGNPVMMRGFTSLSIRANGRTTAGTAVDVYAHIPSYLTSLENITSAMKSGLIDQLSKKNFSSAPIPQTELQRLADLDKLSDSEGNRLVWVIDYQGPEPFNLKPMHVDNALDVPRVIAFLGGKERAQKYLQRHKEFFRNKLHFTYHLDDPDQPHARFLAIVGDQDSTYNGTLYEHFGGSAIFLGVPAHDAQPKIVRPNLDQILRP